MTVGTEEFIDLATADKFLEEKWSKKATVERKKKLVFAAQVDRQFESELKRGQILRIGNITQPTARAKSANTAITFETVAETEKTITIDNYYYSAIAIEDVIKPMLSINIAEKYIPGLAYAVGVQEETDLAGFIDNDSPNGVSYTVGTLATGLTYDNLVRGDQYLNDALVPDDGRVIICSPAEKANMLKMDQFINRDYADIRTGLLGKWMNYELFFTTTVDGSNAAGHDNVMMHKECIAHIAQIQPTVQAWHDRDYMCAKMSCLTTYGSTIRRADHGVWLKGL